MKSLKCILMKILVYRSILLFSLFGIETTFGQSVIRLTPSSISGATCPSIGIDYKVTVPSDCAACKIQWSATNGLPTIDQLDQTKVSISWDDTPGAMGTVTATFSNCGQNNVNEGKTASLSELILSVKDQAFDSFTSSVNIPYCSTSQINLSVPHMYVTDTGETHSRLCRK